MSIAPPGKKSPKPQCVSKLRIALPHDPDQSRQPVLGAEKMKMGNDADNCGEPST